MQQNDINLAGGQELPDLAVPAGAGPRHVALPGPLPAGHLYTLSTVTTARKGRHEAAPPRASFPMPYTESFGVWFEPPEFRAGATVAD